LKFLPLATPLHVTSIYNDVASKSVFGRRDLANRVDAPYALPMLRQLIRLVRRAHQANGRDV